MRKLPLTLLGLYVSVLSAFSQIVGSDTTTYKNRKLKLEEVNFVSSYYSQNGNNSAVTGGRGTERLTDNSNLFDLKFARYDRRNRSHTLNLQLGVDAYSSASSDKIDPSTISSASRSDRRIYPSITYSVKNDAKGQVLGVIGYFSREYDYTSLSPGINFTKISNDKNREFSVKFQAFFDNWKIILPVELRNVPGAFTGTSRRNSYNGSFIYSAVINQRSQFALLFDLAYQTGMLGTAFHRVYFQTGEERVEKLPSTRFKLPLGVRLNYFLNDRFVIRSYYRFYYDTWNLWAHTFSVELPVKITPMLSAGPVYRFYTQTAVDYFAPYAQHVPGEEYYTSDYDLSRFSSHLIGVNFRYVSAGGILGIKKLNSVDIRYGHYYRTTHLTSNIITLALKFK